MLAAAILLGVLVVVQLVALAWITAAQAGYMERTDERHAAQVDRLLTAHDYQQGLLLQRIQAPEAAVVQHQIQSTPDVWSPPGLPFEDDDAFRQSREELADLVAKHDGIGD